MDDGLTKLIENFEAYQEEKKRWAERRRKSDRMIWLIIGTAEIGLCIFTIVAIWSKVQW